MRLVGAEFSQGYGTTLVPRLWQCYAWQSVEGKRRTATAKNAVAVLKFIVSVLAFRQHNSTAHKRRMNLQATRQGRFAAVLRLVVSALRALGKEKASS